VLVDTDVYSFLIKGDTRAAVYTPHLRDKTIAISFVTVGELYYWAKKRNWSNRRRADLEVRLRAVVIVPFDLQVCRAYGEISALKNSDGSDRVIAANDRWVAACAIRHNLALVSNNRRHFEYIPQLALISEAPAPRKATTQTLPLPDAPESR
jgi:tRNA(fMet)-specific endonuclease VapC